MIFPTATDLALFYRSIADEGLDDYLPVFSNTWAEKTEQIIRTVQLAQRFSERHTDLYYCAADIFYKVCKNHVHPDGNKRTAILTSTFFLLQNGIRLSVLTDVLYEQVKSVACDSREQDIVIAEVADAWSSSHIK